MSLVSIYALHTCVQCMDYELGCKFSETQHFEYICVKSLEVGQILFEKNPYLFNFPHDLFLSFHPKCLTVTITHYYISFSQKPLYTLTILPLRNPKTSRNPSNGQEIEPTTNHSSCTRFKYNPSSESSSKDRSPVQITRSEPMTILVVEATMKDKELGVHV